MTDERAPSPTPAAEPLLVNTRKITRQATSRTAFREELFPEDDPLLDFMPYCHKQPRSNSITPEVQRAFIYHLAASGIVKQAATKVGKSIEALEWGRMRLEDCAMERAIHDGAHNPRANSMICFVIKHRSQHMVDTRFVKPGHWLWERIHHEITGRWSEEEEEEAETNDLP